MFNVILVFCVDLVIHKVACSDDGLEAIVFTAQGDMRQVSVWRCRAGECVEI